MNDIRSEIRAEFEREQAAFPPPSDLRPRFVLAAVAQPRSRLGLQWVAAVAVLLIAALIVAALVSSRVGLRITTPAATPSAPGDYGPPPAGVNLIWVHDRDHPTWLTGYDWTGQPRGTIKATEHDLTMAPDGQSFSAGVSAKGGHWRFFDRLGKEISTDEVGNPYSVRYADDNQHVCAMTQDPTTLAYTLSTFLPGKRLTSVGEIARDPFVGQTVVVLGACSFRNDRAIAYRISISAVTEAWVVRLSDGKVLSHHTYATAVPILVASRDASYLAEGSGDGPIVIRRVSDWTQVGSVAAGVNPIEFSGDDSRLMVSSLYDTQGRVTGMVDVDWAAGQAVWSNTSSGSYFAALVVYEPGGQAFVVATGVPDSSDASLYDLTIVQGSGASLEIGRFQIAF